MAGGKCVLYSAYDAKRAELAEFGALVLEHNRFAHEIAALRAEVERLRGALMAIEAFPKSDESRGFSDIRAWEWMRAAARAALAGEQPAAAHLHWTNRGEWQCTCGVRNGPGTTECSGCHCQPHQGCIQILTPDTPAGGK